MTRNQPRHRAPRSYRVQRLVFLVVVLASALGLTVFGLVSNANAVQSPFGPDDHSPGCVTRDEFDAVKPVDNRHFAPYALTRVQVNQWFDARPSRVQIFSGRNVGGIFVGGTERIQTYHACYGIPRFHVPKGQARVIVEFFRSPILRQSGFPGFHSTDVYTF